MACVPAWKPLRGAWVLAALLSCGDPPGPALTGVEPSSISQGKQTTVVVRGRNLNQPVVIDLDDKGPADFDKTWGVAIGAQPLSAESIQWRNAQTLTVLVPGTLAAGTYDLTITTPAQRHLTLSPGLSVLDPDPGDQEPMAAPDAGPTCPEGPSPACGVDVPLGPPADAGAPPLTSSPPADAATAPIAAPADAAPMTPPPALDAAAPGSEPLVEAGTSPDELVTDASIAPGNPGLDAGASDAGDGGGDAGVAAEGGVGDPSDAGPRGLEPLAGALVHRYSFELAGTDVVDGIGGADGLFIGGTLDGMSGAAAFTGGGEYVDLPNGLISVYEAVTLEVWVIWDAPAADSASSWQRIFDLGSSNAAEGSQGSGANTHLFLTPRASGVNGALQASYRGAGTGGFSLNASDPLPTQTLQHVAVVVDGPSSLLELYHAGSLIASRALAFPLSSIDDRNNWLGRSQLQDDPPFQGRLFEFRIYDQALDEQSLSLSYAAGPNAVF